MKLSTREAALLGLLLVLGGIFLTNHYIFQPLIKHKQQLVLENNNLTQELQALQNRISKYQSMERDNRKSRDDYQSMLEAVPQSAMIPSIIDYLELSAREAHVKLITLRYKESAPGDPAPKSAKSGTELMQTALVNFQIVASGNHFDLLSFVREIEKASRIYIVSGGKIYLARSDQSLTGITTSPNSPDMAASDKPMEKTVPESLTYDQSKSVLSLDFSAYYHRSLSNGAAQP